MTLEASTDWSRVYEHTIVVAGMLYCGYAVTGKIEGGLLAAVFISMLLRIEGRE